MIKTQLISNKDPTFFLSANLKKKKKLLLKESESFKL